MFSITDLRLAKRSRIFRYFFYLVSGFRLKSFRSWSQEGEPNPFVAKTYPVRRTERIEFIDIFDDVL